MLSTMFTYLLTYNKGVSVVVTIRVRVQELCESQSAHPGLPIPNSSYDLCGCKATLNLSNKGGWKSAALL